MCVSARIDGEGHRVMDLLQHNSKRDKGRIFSAQKVKLPPHQSGASLMNCFILSSPVTGRVLHPLRPFTSKVRQSQYLTALSSKRLLPTMVKDGRHSGMSIFWLSFCRGLIYTVGPRTSGGSSLPLPCESNPIIVRGRSPGHYAEARAGSSEYSPQGPSATTEDLFI